jgi:hypothetical protein
MKPMGISTVDATYWSERAVKAEAEIERLRVALKPFADAVYNDNGDMTIDHAGIGIEQFATAYFVMRRTNEQIKRE